MRDDNRRAAAHQTAQRRLHVPLRLGVERRGGLVEQQDRRVLQHRARDRDALPLPAGEPDAMLADRRVVALRQVADEGVGGGGNRGGLDIGVRRTEPAIGDVGAHRVVEQADLLRDQRDRAAQRGERHRADFLPVDQNAAGIGVVKARDQVEQRRFSGAGGPTSATVLPAGTVSEIPSSAIVPG